MCCASLVSVSRHRHANPRSEYRVPLFYRVASSDRSIASSLLRPARYRVAIGAPPRLRYEMVRLAIDSRNSCLTVPHRTVPICTYISSPLRRTWLCVCCAEHTSRILLTVLRTYSSFQVMERVAEFQVLDAIIK
ncbi:hypothetical protein VTN96DRAFT_3463 [Rasamsonia emersonii]